MPFGTTEKIMSITRAEFEASLAALDPAAQIDAQGFAQVRVAGVQAAVRFEELPRRWLGGLISMPQARVSLLFDGLAEAERDAFQRAFDIAFQRGGG